MENAARLHGIARLKREAAAHLGAEDKQVGDRAGLESRFASLDSLWMAYQPIVRAGDGHIGYPEGMAFADRNNFAPRLGLALTPGSGRNVLRAGWGIVLRYLF